MNQALVLSTLRSVQANQQMFLFHRWEYRRSTSEIQLVLQFMFLLRYYRCGVIKLHTNSVFKLLLGVFARSAAGSASCSALFVV